MMHQAENIALTSSEIAHLWTSYIMNSKSKYMLQYAAEKTDDEELKAVHKLSLDIAERNVKDIEAIFKTVNHPIPYGFKESDVRLHADKIYSDVLLLQILRSYITFGLANYGIALSLSARPDVRKLFTDGMIASVDLMNKANDAAINKGFFLRTPTIPIPKAVEYAESQSVMGALLGHKRPMNGLEVANIFNISYECCVHQGLLTGLAQTAEQEELRLYFAKGRKLMMEHVHTLNRILSEEDLTYPAPYDTEVLNTTYNPFSGKIASYFAVTSITEVLGAYSTAKMNVMRKDLFLVLTQLSSEIVMYIKDGMDIMIDNGWWEELPKNVDRDDLIDQK